MATFKFLNRNASELNGWLLLFGTLFLRGVGVSSETWIRRGELRDTLLGQNLDDILHLYIQIYEL